MFFQRFNNSSTKELSFWLVTSSSHFHLILTLIHHPINNINITGDTVILSIMPFISRSAFNFTSTPPDPSSKDDNSKPTLDSFKETAFEKLLSERKTALNRLFKKVSLTPIKKEIDIVASGTNGSSSTSHSKTKVKSKKVDTVIDSDDEGGKDGEGEKMNDDQLNLVYARAVKNDALLPEMDPPESFKLELRPYQKQALKWMAAMEGGNEAREELALHPLFNEFVRPSTLVF